MIKQLLSDTCIVEKWCKLHLDVGRDSADAYSSKKVSKVLPMESINLSCRNFLILEILLKSERMTKNFASAKGEQYWMGFRVDLYEKSDKKSPNSIKLSD